MIINTLSSINNELTFFNLSTTIIKSDCLCLDLCKDIINNAEKFHRSFSYDINLNSYINNLHRNSSNFYIKKELNSFILEIINKNVLGLVNVKISLTENIFNCYTKNDFFKTHTDNSFTNNNELIITNRNRNLSVVILLNKDYEGGELVFNSLIKDNKQLTLKLKTGEMILFPSDIRFPHSVNPILKGKRFSIANWYKVV